MLDRQPASVLREHQLKRALKLVRHAAAESSWWAERLAPAWRDGQLRWSEIPVLTREDFRAQSVEPLPVPREHGRTSPATTSGSSGTPVRLHRTQYFHRFTQTLRLHDLRRQGFDPHARRAIITQDRIEHAGEHAHLPASPLFGMGETFVRRAPRFSVEAHARWLAELGPASLSIAPTMLRGILEVYASDQTERPPIRRIRTFAETVDPTLRRDAREILGASIHDFYSSEEAGPIAFQCPRSDDFMHVAASNALVEIVDESGRPCRSGQVGRVVATGFNNYAAPVIRYELGDLAAARQGCPCGFEGPVLEQLLGRIRFLIRLPSGERRYVGASTQPWLEIVPFKERRLVQVSEGVIRVEMVLDRPLTDAERDGLVMLLRTDLSPELTYEVVQVPAIAWTPGDKRQDVVSLI